MSKGLVSVKYVPPKTEGPILDVASIRIEIDEDQPERVWIWMIKNGIKVEGGSFPLAEFLEVILEYYKSSTF